MLNIYILRHAIAVDRETSKHDDDSVRPLTPEGKEKMVKVSKGMQALELIFDLILSSPYVRANETAQIVLKGQGLKEKQLRLTENLVPGASFPALIEELNAFAKKTENILLVGHEPHLSELISYLLAGNTDIQINFKKAGLCLVTCATPCTAGGATLQWLLTPSQLCQIK